MSASEFPAPMTYPDRNRRVREVRAITLSPRQNLAEVKAGRLLYPEKVIGRPRTRAQCVDGLRPCPWASCRHHLAVDVTPSGSLKINFPDLETEELAETCSLDVADRGGETLHNVAQLMNLTRERLRQLEEIACARAEALGLLDPFVEDEDRTKGESE